MATPLIAQIVFAWLACMFDRCQLKRHSGMNSMLVFVKITLISGKIVRFCLSSAAEALVSPSRFPYENPLCSRSPGAQRL